MAENFGTKMSSKVSTTTVGTTTVGVWDATPTVGVWDAAFSLYYKWTTWYNSYGRITSWIDNTDPKNIKWCRGLVRDSDGLVFVNSLSCSECSDYSMGNYSKKQRCKLVNGCYLSGTDVFNKKW